MWCPGGIWNFFGSLHHEPQEPIRVSITLLSLGQVSKEFVLGYVSDDADMGASSFNRRMFRHWREVAGIPGLPYRRGEYVTLPLHSGKALCKFLLEHQ